jgi:tetratricopeptide (TPR) repeat protein
VTDPRARDPIGVGARRIEAIQLWCQEAGSGLGAPLHGFSGSPCLIDGCAVGLLRSTLSTSALDGQGRPQLLTQGGTAYACPATVIVDRDDPPDRLPIPGGWSRPVAASDFVVVTSVNEKTARQKLVTVAENAREKVPELGLGPAWALEAEEQVASEEALLGAVRILCRARVVVFDATGFEPAVMLLLGIRAAVRRGVTILSIGGSYVLGDRVSVPFNLLDANIVSHSTNQDRSGDEETTPIPLLARRIERSVKQIGSPHYFDLPVFEAVRRLPAERRGVRPAESGVLVLCSFAPAYTKKNWAGRLKMAFKNQLANYRAQRKDRPIAADELGVSRSFELNSPQLVSRAIYEEIRRAQACVVDLTEWPANVLFELGVRLAVSRHPTTCIVERKLRFPKGCDVQCERLLALLVPESQRYDVDKAYLEEPVFARVYGPKAVLPVAGISAGMVYECVERGLQVDGEPAERPVYRELLDSAELFARVSVRAGVTKPVGLFPGNPELTDLEENAEFQRLLAAWLFLLTQFGEQKIAQDTGTLRASAEQIVDALIGRHQRGLDPLGEVMATLKRMQAAFATAGLKPEARLDELVALKQKATALRKSGELDLALATLNLVEKGLATMQAERRDDPKLVTQLRAELADTFGMRGGVHRRRNDLAAALADYKKGLDEEKEAGQSTYNLGNVITLSITLNHESPNDPQMRRRLDRAIELLERQTQSSRGDEWWALSDLGQFYLLRGDLDAARAAYARGRRLGPSREESGRHVDVLEELANAVKQNDGDLTQKMAVLIGELKATLR